MLLHVYPPDTEAKAREIDGWLNVWVEDTSTPLEAEFREASILHTPIGQNGGYQSVQLSANLFRELMADLVAHPPAAPPVPPSYTLKSTKGETLGPAESRVVALMRRILAKARDTQAIEAVVFTNSILALVDRFGDAFDWRSILGSSYDRWGPEDTRALARATRRMTHAEAQAVVTSLDSLSLGDLVALILVEGPQALTHGLRALWEDPETYEDIPWTESEICACQALGGLDFMAHVLDDQLLFSQV